MPLDRQEIPNGQPVVEFRLLGRVSFARCLELQNRLVYEAGGLIEPRIVVLLCEHPELITVGRMGSRGHIRLSDEQLKHEQLQIQWVSRGGGCVLHAPGQLAVYPIVPLGVLGWTVGHYLRQLQRGVLDALDGLGIRGETRKRSFGVWGRSGQLACMGAAIRNWVSLHGVFLNVNPPMRHFAFVDSCPEAEAEGPVKTTMGCLLAERQASVKMTGVRAALVESLAAAFGSERYHLFTGHPWLKPGTACASNIGEL